MIAMTRPSRSSKVVLVADRRAAAAESAAISVRRYRLARLRFDRPAASPGSRFEHLKHVYD
jgi:hypothetical protein